MKEEMKIKDQENWHGSYKGISFKITKWKRDLPAEHDMGYTWNYYLYVKPRKIRTIKGFSEGTRRVDYSKMYGDVEMHCGITYWSRYKSSTLNEYDEIGCDYAHLWDLRDEGRSNKFRERTVENIKLDVKNSIDSLPKDLFWNKEK